MNRVPHFTLLLCLLCLLLVSCQYQYVSGAKLGLRDYPDSVVHISQVDPEYRGYFAAQHGSSFSLSDQRKAFTQARETARTPVSESAYRAVAAPSRKKKVRRSTRTASRGKKATRSRKAATRRKGTARRKATPRRRRR